MAGRELKDCAPARQKLKRNSTLPIHGSLSSGRCGRTTSASEGPLVLAKLSEAARPSDITALLHHAGNGSAEEQRPKMPTTTGEMADSTGTLEVQEAQLN
ncbi:hypothetical protein NDU88_002422 [Pleurodeles waltl]|uniref:Uncharacterized protein n=1 Tax=Pleurodeles waltl TaxID=8319 RepID=A0AAV7P9X3_PLEWA|nr:hypothetical protein NDU88_002422 [Pleurodeles waltl]